MIEKCACYVMLNSKRAPVELLEIFPDRRVPVKFPVLAGNMTHAKLSGAKAFYLVAVERLTKEQRDRTVKFMAAKFELDEDDVDRNLEKEGLPIRDEIINTISWCPLHIRCVL